MCYFSATTGAKIIVVRTGHRGYFLLKVVIKNYNFMVDENFFFDKPVRNYIRAHDNIQKRTTAQVDDYTTGYLLDYPYFEKKL